VSLRGPRTGDALLIENGAYPAVDGNGDGLVARTEDLIAAERAQDVAIGGFNAVGALHELHRRGRRLQNGALGLGDPRLQVLRAFHRAIKRAVKLSYMMLEFDERDAVY